MNRVSKENSIDGWYKNLVGGEKQGDLNFNGRITLKWLLQK
jgi:hypothetical protein